MGFLIIFPKWIPKIPTFNHLFPKTSGCSWPKANGLFGQIHRTSGDQLGIPEGGMALEGFGNQPSEENIGRSEAAELQAVDINGGSFPNFAPYPSLCPTWCKQVLADWWGCCWAAFDVGFGYLVLVQSYNQNIVDDVPKFCYQNILIMFSTQLIILFN